MVEVPLFIVNGLLESGKTTLIKEIIENNVSYQAGNTLLIVCEEGVEEYEKDWCEQYQVPVAYVDSIADLTKEYLISLDDLHTPAQIVVELNGFWNISDLEFPEYMPVYQQLTLIDATTFGVGFNNMRQIFKTLVENSGLVIFNRSDGVKELASYRRQIRALNKDCQIAFEGKNGQLTAMLDEDLPYDIKKSVITLEDEDYPTWYIDVFDHYEKYFGKTIRFKTFVRDILEETIVVGRNVMTCCEADVQFLGYEVLNAKEPMVAIGDCIFLECEVKFGYSKFAGEDVVLLEAKKISKLKKEEDKVLGM